MNTNDNNRVLLIEDSADIQLIVGRALSGVGIELLTATTAAEGLRIFREQEINLILLDIVIPVMNGIEILKELRREKLADDVPIVMLTNQNDDKNLAEAKALGVSGYIVKSAATPSEVVIEVMKIIKNEGILFYICLLVLHLFFVESFLW